MSSQELSSHCQYQLQIAGGKNAPPIQTVMVPLDGSLRAEQALGSAELLAHALGSTVLLARVIPVVSPATALATLGAVTSPEVYQRLYDDEERLAREYLDAQADKLRTRGSKVRTLLTRGETATCLLDLEIEEHVDLVVMTTHGRTGVARFALGSIADRLVCHGTVPALLLRSFGQECPTPALERALVPLDGSVRAERALDLALRLAGPVVRQLHLVRVVETRSDAVINLGTLGVEAEADSGVREDSRAGVGGSESEVTREAQEYLEALAARYAPQIAARSCPLTTRVLIGDVAGQIVDQAAQGCDLVIMATHGRSGLARWALGSVAERVMHGGTTPLLLVRSIDAYDTRTRDSAEEHL